jgi:hypothetical protein
VKDSSTSRALFILLSPWLVAATAALCRPTGASAQGGLDQSSVDAYFRTVGAHFQVPLQEVAILGDWELEPEEVAVVLFVARHVAVSPDVVVALRSGGMSWMSVALRFGLAAGSFHLPLPQAASLGGLTRAYEGFRARPPREWGNLRLEDSDLVALVNLRILSEQLAVEPVRVLQVWNETGDFVTCHRVLLRGIGSSPALSIL